MADLIKVELKNLFHTQGLGGGVFLGNDEKTFAIFIGPGELNALLLAGNGVTPPRPLTHNLIDKILDGFEIHVKQVVIREIVDDAFHATLTLTQDGHDVEIDCRPSDALVLAVLHKTPIFVTRRVLDEVEDGRKLFRAMLEQAKKEVAEGRAAEPPAAKKASKRGKKPAKEDAKEGAEGEPEPLEEINPDALAEEGAGEEAPPKPKKPKNRVKKFFDVRDLPGIDWGSAQ